MGQMYCVYRGTFTGRTVRPDRDTDWMVELWRRLDERPARVGELKFPADSPLRIEWEEWRPETALQGSMLTLNIESMTDREFINFYTNRVGNIYIKVYRRGWQATLAADEPRGWCMVWRGALDPEFYEEPYERADGYTVSMTFSDFGALDRLDFDRAKTEHPEDDVCPIMFLMAAALHDSGLIDDPAQWIQERTPDSSYYCEPVQTQSVLIGHGGHMASIQDLSAISLPWGNFEDEEGTPVTWRDAIETCLVPVGLHMVQRGGRFLIYDTSWLHYQTANGASTRFIHWTADQQTLGTAGTYNNIEVTFSPYARTQVITGDVELTNDTTKLSRRKVFNYGIDSNATDVSEAFDNMYDSFEITTTQSGEGPHHMSINESRFFRIKALMGSASDRSGVLCTAKPRGKGESAADMSSLPRLFSFRSSILAPPLYPSHNYLRLSFDMLFDPRYNPFEDWTPDIKNSVNHSDVSEKEWNAARWVAVPLNIRLLTPDGKVTYCYSNRAVYEANNFLKRYPTAIQLGSWVKYEAGQDYSRVCFAQFYADEQDKPALDGWTTNRHTIGVWVGGEKINSRITKLPDGMLIPYPPTGGIIEVSVLDAVIIHDDDWLKAIMSGQGFANPSINSPEKCRELTQKVRWRAFSDMRLEIVKDSVPFLSDESEDITQQGEVVSDTREQLEVQTQCGSIQNPDASMLGIYRVGRYKTAARSMIRAGRIGAVEQILIGALFSQYEPRRVTLYGEAEERVMDRFPVYRDHNMGDRVFLLTASTLDAINGTEVMTVTELLPDTYGAEATRHGAEEWEPNPQEDPKRDPGDNYPFEFDPEDYETPEPPEWEEPEPPEWDDDYWDDGRDDDRPEYEI